MAFDNAHDFKIDTANMGTTNNGPLMFWNNTYHPGSVHNHAVVTSGTPTTFYMGGAAPPPPPPPRIQERDRSDYSWDNRSEFTDTSSRGRPPPQQPPYESPPPALGAPRGPGSPASESASSYQSQHYPRSSEASPQPQHAEASNSDRDYYDPPRAEGMGQPSEARLASREAEAIPARPTESPPPRENVHTGAASSASGSVHGAEEHDHTTPKKKRRFWEKMKVWGSKGAKAVEKR